MTKKREDTKTTLSLAPLTVDEALSALLKRPPPPAGDKAKDKKRRNKNATQRKR